MAQSMHFNNQRVKAEDLDTVMQSMDAAYNFNDLAGLNKITMQGEENEAAALKEIAKQFESMFVRMMIKSMRDANAPLEEGGMFSSNESKFYRDMFDDQLALSLSKDQGIGLADSLYRQLSAHLEPANNGEKSGKLSKDPFNLNEDPAREAYQLPERRIFSIHHAGINSLNTSQTESIDAQGRDLQGHSTEKMSAPMAQLNAVQQGTNARNIEKSADRSTSDTDVRGPVKSAARKMTTFNSVQEFVDHIWPIATEVGEKLGIAPKAITAQAALETGWGKHVIHTHEGENSFNLFGIKSDTRWNGASAKVATLEFRDGVANKEMAPFRVYESYDESVQDYAQFIKDSDRYQEALSAGKNIKAYSEGLQAGGYATDPNYALKIQRIANSERLNDAIQIAMKRTSK